MMARGLAMALLALLGGCTTAKEIYLPNGVQGYDIRCDGLTNRLENCFQKAGEICGAKGYDLANVQGSYIVTSSLLIKCKEYTPGQAGGRRSDHGQLRTDASRNSRRRRLPGRHV